MYFLYFSSEFVLKGLKGRRLCYSLYPISKSHQHTKTKQAKQASCYKIAPNVELSIC